MSKVDEILARAGKKNVVALSERNMDVVNGIPQNMILKVTDISENSVGRENVTLEALDYKIVLRSVDGLKVGEYYTVSGEGLVFSPAPADPMDSMDFLDSLEIDEDAIAAKRAGGGEAIAEDDADCEGCKI